MIPADVVRETFAAFRRFLAELQVHYQEQTDLIAQRLDVLDGRITSLEHIPP
jgi:hypothetical protein